MKVQDLIAILEDCDPEAEVYVMSQQHYPFECALHGVAQRQEFTESSEDDEEIEGDGSAPRDRWTASDSALPKTDVFLVEGSQLRYGSRDAWDAAQRA